MNYKIFSILLSIVILESCSNPTSTDNSVNFDSEEQVAPPPPPDGSEYTEGEMEGDGGQNLTPSEIQWKDGKSYTYDYTEVIDYIDRAGETHQITVYKRNQPTTVHQCDLLTCKWCSKQYDAVNYSVKEYPNISWMTKLEKDMNFDEVAEMAFILVIEKSSHWFNDEARANFYDLENNRVRIEWQYTCNYNSKDFCSLKCESEYNNH